MASPGNLEKELKKTDWRYSAMTAVIECGFKTLPHYPYSSYMAPSDFLCKREHVESNA